MIKQNPNNINNMPQMIKPQNIPNKINEVKKDEPKLEKKVQPKPEPKKEEKGPEEIPHERRLSFQDKLKLMQGNLKLNNPQQPRGSQMPGGKGFSDKMKNMAAMFEKRGGFGAPRPSAQIMGMPHGFSPLMINNNNNRMGQQAPIVEENEDLEKKLENIVVQKNKKKKKRIDFIPDNE